LKILKSAAQVVESTNMQLHAGHGLTYTNVVPVAQIDGMLELNIGHSIISRSIFVGMQEAVREMKRLCNLWRRVSNRVSASGNHVGQIVSWRFDSRSSCGVLSFFS
jgi:hypothetical protein